MPPKDLRHVGGGEVQGSGVAIAMSFELASSISDGNGAALASRRRRAGTKCPLLLNIGSSDAVLARVRPDFLGGLMTPY